MRHANGFYFCYISDQENHYENDDEVATRDCFVANNGNVDNEDIAGINGEPPIAPVNINIGRGANGKCFGSIVATINFRSLFFFLFFFFLVLDDDDNLSDVADEAEPENFDVPRADIISISDTSEVLVISDDDKGMFILLLLCITFYVY